MEPINSSLLERATDLFNSLAKRVGSSDISKIRPIRGHISEYLFCMFHEYCMSENKAIDMAFHGTGGEVADSVQLYGMFDPTFAGYNVKNGNVWGKGVYVSPNINFAKGYARNNGIIIAGLIIKGVTEKEKFVTGHNDLNSDSQVIGDIIVLRSTSQMLPLFVVPGTCVNTANINNTVYDQSYVDELLTVEPANVEMVNTTKHLKAMFPKVKFGVIYQLLFRKKLDVNATCDDLTNLNYEDY